MSKNKALAVFPAPRSFMVAKRLVDLSSACWIHLDQGCSAGLINHVLDFRKRIQRFWVQPLELTMGMPGKGSPLIQLHSGDTGLAKEGYTLRVNKSGIVVTSNGEVGAFYGLQSLYQIIAQTGAQIPELSIDDSPDFPNRAFMLDITRCKVPTMETLFKIVDMMAMLKLNQLQLYTEHTFAFAAHEVVWHDSSPMTAEEIVRLDVYCRDRYIELVPNFNSFGHLGRWLKHPEYLHLAECSKKAGQKSGLDVLYPDQTSLRFLDSLYSELLPNFKSRLFNVGCDETHQLGQGRSKSRCERLGMERVYLEFLKKINNLVRKHGRTMMFWADIVRNKPEYIPEIPEGVIALEFGYEADWSYARTCPVYERHKIPYYVCPGTSSWNSFTGRTDNALVNLEQAARHGLRHGALGYLVCDWGDGGHHQYLPISYPGILAGAAYSWCHIVNKNVNVADALDRLVFKDNAGVMGKTLMGLGNVYQLVSKRCHLWDMRVAWFNDWLFLPIGGVKEEFKITELRSCLDAFDSIQSAITNSRARCDDADVVKAEVMNAIAMARLSVKRALLVLDKRSFRRDELRRELQHVIGEHERLWMIRNRVGGLHESSNRLRERLND